MNSPQSDITSKSGKRILDVFLLAFLGILMYSIVVLCCVPPVSRDALAHHLAVPKLYISHGGIFEIPFMDCSYYPMNLDLIYLIFLYFGNDIVPKFVHFSFALLTAWLIFGYLKRRIDTTYALGGVLFFLCIPIIVKLSIMVYVDLGLVFFSTASLLVLLRWAEKGYRTTLLVVSGILCGLAMGTKYNGLVAFAVLTLCVPMVYARYAPNGKAFFSKGAFHALLFLLVALICFSPWMVRNYLWTSNPLYPLYDHWFNAHSQIAQNSINPFTLRSYAYDESWWEMILLPLRMFFQGQDGNPQYFDGKISPFLLFLPPFAFFRAERERKVLRAEKKVFFAFSLIFFLFAFFTNGLRIRYIAPIIPPLVILSVFGVKKLSDLIEDIEVSHLRVWGRVIILTLVLFALGLNAQYIFTQYRSVKPLSYLRGELTRDEYIERYRPEYAAMRFINQKLSPNARVLFIHMGNRGYYCDREYVFDMRNNTSMLQQMAMGLDAPDEILLRLREKGITHLLINIAIFNRWLRDGFEAKDRELVQKFLEKYSKPLYLKSGYGLFELNSVF